MDVNLRDLRYFVAVAEELHFTRAAERLFVSQPVLSRQVARLETQLRVRLLVRTRRSVELTPAGAVLLERARILLGDWDAARRDINDVSAMADSVVRVGIQTSVGRGVLKDLADRLALEHPGWRLDVQRVTWSDPSVGLMSGDVDLAIAWLPPTPIIGMHHRVIATERQHLAVASDHPIAGRAQVEFSEIVGEPLVALPESAGPMRAFWLAEAQRRHPAPIAAEADNAEAALEAVASGIGSALIAEGNAQLYRRDDVATVPVIDLPDASLAIYWRTDDERPMVLDLVGAG